MYLAENIYFPGHRQGWQWLHHCGRAGQAREHGHSQDRGADGEAGQGQRWEDHTF